MISRLNIVRLEKHRHWRDKVEGKAKPVEHGWGHVLKNRFDSSEGFITIICHLSSTQTALLGNLLESDGLELNLLLVLLVSLLGGILVLLCPLLDLTEGGVAGCLAELGLLLAALLDLFHRHALDSAERASGLLSLLLSNQVLLALLVKRAPSLRPGQLLVLDLLVVQRLALGVEEHQQLAVLANKAATMTRVDLVVAEKADVGLYNHGLKRK